MVESYITPAHGGTFTYEEKKSVFIGEAIPCEREEDAIAFIASVRAKYPDARHHVYAYLLRENSKNRYSDDHEPQGTAGMPVLDVIRKSGIVDAAVVVTRYFGGTLLGAGGLVRAYTAAAAGAVKDAGVLHYRTYQPFLLGLSYTDYNKLIPEIEKREIKVVQSEFAEGVTLTMTMPVEQFADFATFVKDATAGRGEILADEPVFDHE